MKILKLLSLFLALSLCHFATQPLPLYAWKKEDLAKWKGLCDKAETLKKGADEESKKSDKQRSDAKKLRLQAETVLKELNPKIKKHEGLKKELSKEIPEAERDLNAISGVRKFFIEHQEICVGNNCQWQKAPQSWKEMQYGPICDWLGQASGCLGGNCPSDFGLPKTGCADPGLYRNGQNSPAVIDKLGCPKEAGATCKESGINVGELKEKISGIAGKKEEMKELKPQVLELRKSYLEKVQDSDDLMEKSADSLAEAKKLGNQAKQKIQEAWQLVPQACGTKVKDYSEEAKKLAEETEALLKTVQGFKLSKK